MSTETDWYCNTLDPKCRPDAGPNLDCSCYGDEFPCACSQDDEGNFFVDCSMPPNR